jgi:nickel/cobalt transporter (NicO) family protein
MNLRWTGTLLGLCLGATTPVLSHPMGNFSISHYARLTFGSQNIDLLYIVDMAEIPAFQEKPLVDMNGNGTVEANEQDAYLSRKVEELTEGLVVRVNGTRSPLVRISQQLELLPGGLNLPTLKIALNYQLPLKAGQLKDVNVLEYEDTNFPGRAGWKEIVVQGDGIEESSASGVDKSQQLTHYPEDPAIRPPEDLVARVRFKRAAGIGNSSSPPRPASAQAQPPSWWLSGPLPVAVFLVLCGSGGFLVWRWYSGRRGA